MTYGVGAVKVLLMPKLNATNTTAVAMMHDSTALITMIASIWRRVML